MKLQRPLITLLIAVFPLVAQAQAAYKKGEQLFLTQRVSAMTDSGISSLLPGTKVKVVDQTASAIKVSTKDGITLEVKPTQVTQDATLAASVEQQYSQSQSALKAKAQSDANKVVLDRARAMESIQATTDKIAAANAVVSTPHEALHGSALDAGPTKTSYKVIRPAKPTPTPTPTPTKR